EGFACLGVQSLVLHNPTRRVAELFASPALASLHKLCWRDSKLGEEGMKALAGCPYLANLVGLDIHLPHCGALQPLAQSPHLGKLRRLTLNGRLWEPWPGITTTGVGALLESPHLRSLSALTLWEGGWAK